MLTPGFDSLEPGFGPRLPNQASRLHSPEAPRMSRETFETLRLRRSFAVSGPGSSTGWMGRDGIGLGIFLAAANLPILHACPQTPEPAQRPGQARQLPWGNAWLWAGASQLLGTWAPTRAAASYNPNQVCCWACGGHKQIRSRLLWGYWDVSRSSQPASLLDTGFEYL